MQRLINLMRRRLSSWEIDTEKFGVDSDSTRRVNTAILLILVLDIRVVVL